MFEIVEMRDDWAIEVALRTDPHWAVYALADLDPPHRQYARYIGALEEGSVAGVLLIYSSPAFTSLIPFGEREAVKHMLHTLPDLPPSTLFQARYDDVPAIEARYTVEERWPMIRMIAEASALLPVAEVDAAVLRLTLNDLAALNELYESWAESVFSPLMLEEGIFYGVYDGKRLVSAAGTHGVSTERGIAILGGVYTRPEYRGHHLARAVTGAVADAVAASGVRLLALNVGRDNAPAVTTYARLGFRIHQPFLEGMARAN